MHSIPLRICILSREYPPETGWGGIATFAKHLAHGLVEIGCEVEVISEAKGPAKEIVDGGVKVHRVEPYFKKHRLDLVIRAMPYTRYAIDRSSALWKKFYEIHQERPFDVVDTPELLAEGFFPALSKVVPLVVRLYTPHSKFIAERFHNVTPSFDHEFIAMIERVAMLFADAITSPSRDLAEYIARDLNYPLDRIALIPNPIDAGKFSPEGPKALTARDQLKILFVGRLEGRKGIEYLIRAVPDVVRAVPEAHFYILGDDTKTASCQTSTLAQLKRITASANCQKSVTFIKRVPLDDLPSYYRSADICVVPSLYDNSPYTCLEAMSCGRPVIGTTAGGMPDYMIHGESGLLLEAKDSNAIAEAIIQLARNPQERQKLGANARQRVLEKFQRAEIARQMTNLYHHAIEQHKARVLPSLYVREATTILSDMEDLADSMNTSLHELLSQRSIRYRAAVLLHNMRMRPKLTLAQGVLKMLKKVLANFNNAEAPPRPIAWLERQIALKHREIFEANRTVVPDHQAGGN